MPGEIVADGEGLSAKVAVFEDVVEADAAVLLEVETVEAVGGDVGFELVTVRQHGRCDANLPRLDRGSVFLGAVDGGQTGNRRVVRTRGFRTRRWRSGL